ncbi:hypothetical protein RFI_32939 [Reticulomyxa filosa]|uniref:Uncharacterized protein n=1 Tax=Reticulomyxa filosa TaxID=46433 RepID=X6LTN0_RETFI|nr:hypothetical protein RFI_32939 [Reticulomyxa filosa]|eukprot:ETO04457.1 hypothetical protein RFI_32939 [Reticulomyxa filosa]
MTSENVKKQSKMGEHDKVDPEEKVSEKGTSRTLKEREGSGKEKGIASSLKKQKKRHTSGYGYVTLVMCGDGYVPGAAVLGHSLRLVKSRHPTIVMVTEDVSEDAKTVLRALYDYVVTVPYIQYESKELKTSTQRQKYDSWKCQSFTKWNCLNLNEYFTFSSTDTNANANANANIIANESKDKDKDKCKETSLNERHSNNIPPFEKVLFLDSDKIVLRNLDHLFDQVQCPAGTFRNPWSPPDQKRTNFVDYYPANLKQGDPIDPKSVYNGLFRNGFVAVGTGLSLSLLFKCTYTCTCTRTYIRIRIHISLLCYK